MQVFSAINSKLDKPVMSSEFTLAIEFMILAIHSITIVLLEALTYLMIARFGGNVFINGIVLSIAEAASSSITGIGMSYFSDVTVTRLCAILSIVFNLLFYYAAGPEYPILQYIILFLGIFG